VAVNYNFPEIDGAVQKFIPDPQQIAKALFVQLNSWSNTRMTNKIPADADRRLECG
jgi:hypothetical protein